MKRIAIVLIDLWANYENNYNCYPIFVVLIGCSSSLLASGSPLITEVLMLLTNKLEQLPNKLYIPEGKKLTVQVFYPQVFCPSQVF